MSALLRRVKIHRSELFALNMSAASIDTSIVVEEVQNESLQRGQKRKTIDTDDSLGTSASPETKQLRSIETFQSGESEYYFDNGLRKVYPYTFRYKTFAKGRWVGRTLIDIFATEFRARPKEYYEKAIESGQITIFNTQVSLDYRIKNNDLMTNDSHRHEVPVIGCPIKIIYQDEEMLVVDKPPSIPVHPCGRYRLNSILSILEKENGFKGLHTLHRLDRLTSGVLMFAKTKERSKFMDNLIKNHLVSKTYICRVEGEFPDGEIVVDKPIDVFSFKIGVCGVSDKGREAQTVFEKLSFNGKSSVVQAKPKQGRMHQIRVHLQYLGHPIVHDRLYNDEVFGKEKAKGGLTEKTPSELVEDLMKIHNLENWLNPMSDDEIDVRKKTFGTFSDSSSAPVLSSTDDFFKNYPKNLEHYITDDFRKTLRGYDQSKMQYVERCPECNRKYIDPSPSSLAMYLHCYKYKGEDFEYTATWPNWAKEDWEID